MFDRSVLRQPVAGRVQYEQRHDRSEDRRHCVSPFDRSDASVMNITVLVDFRRTTWEGRPRISRRCTGRSREVGASLAGACFVLASGSQPARLVAPGVAAWSR
jgi:hypothetical protein